MKNFFNPGLLLDYLPQLLSCLPVTIFVMVSVSVLAFLLGILTAISRLLNIPVLKQISIVIISYTRNTPVIIQLFIIYYAMPMLLMGFFGIDCNGWSPIVYALITYTLHTSTFFSESIKSAIQSIDRGQIEAAFSIGMTRPQAYTRIIFPQAFLISFPTLSITVTSLLKDTAISYMVGVIDVMGKATEIGGRTYHQFEAFIDAAVIFLALNFVLAILFSTVERKIRKVGQA